MSGLRDVRKEVLLGPHTACWAYMLLERLLLVAKVTLAVGQEVISGPDEHQLYIQTHKSLQLEASILVFRSDQRV